MIPHWLWVFMGLNGSGPFYAFWSAIAGSFIFTLILGGAGYWWHNVCVQHKCLRVARHIYTEPDTGVAHKSCRKHHPQIDHTKPIDLAAIHTASQG